MYETFRTESKIKHTSERKSWKNSHQISQNVALALFDITNFHTKNLFYTF